MNNISTTHRLILSVINPDTHKREIKALLSQKIDWRDFLKKSYAHRIAPLIYYNLKKLDLLSFIPKPTVNGLEAAYIYTSRVNMVFAEELKHILNAFQKEGISCIILKGMAFVETIYQQNPGIRPLKDIDLLLRKEDVKEASLVLKHMGYQFYDRYRSEPFYWQSHFHLPFEKKEKRGNFHLEIHWDLLEPDLPVSLDVKGFWQRAVEIDFWGIKAKTLHPDDALTYLIWHTAKDGFYELLGLADLLYLIKYHRPCWDKIIRQIEDGHLVIPLYWTSYIIARLFNLNLVPVPKIDPVSKTFTKIFFTKKNIMEQFILSDWTILHLVHLFMFENRVYGLRNIINRVSPFPTGLKTMGHFIYSSIHIGLRYIQTKG